MDRSNPYLSVDKSRKTGFLGFRESKQPRSDLYPVLSKW